MMKEIYSLSLLILFSHQVNALIHKIGNSPFWRDDGDFTWQECRSNAIAQGWELASIHSSAENSEIQASLDNKPYWIGGFQPGNTGPWAWSDGTPWSYTNWRNGQPDDKNNAQHYVVMGGGGRWNDLNKSVRRGCIYRERSPWLVGPATIALNGGNNYFDGVLSVSNNVGSKVDLSNVVVQLFDFNCANEKDKNNSTNAVTIPAIDTSQAHVYGYIVDISQSNIGDDTGGFVFPTGPSTGDVKFCTRVSTMEGSIQVAFRETNFILSYDLTENAFSLDVQLSSNFPVLDSFSADVDTAFSVLVYQCNNYDQTTTYTIQQDENLVICLEPVHPEGMAHVVHISNFSIKIFAGTPGTPNYVEYNPVWFSTGGWIHDSLTSVSEQPDPSDIIMISTPVIAQFFIQGHTSISVSGSCFLEFDSNKDAKAPVLVGYEMNFGVVELAQEGCLGTLIKKIRGLF